MRDIYYIVPIIQTLKAKFTQFNKCAMDNFVLWKSLVVNFELQFLWLLERNL